MRSKILSKRALPIVVFSGLIIFVAILLYFIPKSSIHGGQALVVGNAAALTNQEQTSIGLPVRLKISRINVDAAIEHLGLTPDGAMDVPKGPAEVAWFNIGPHPGESGSAVIAGHNGWRNNIPAAFDNLYKLRKGDKVSVEDEKGVIITFVVREIRIYGKDEAAPDVFGSNDGKAHLNLVTCAGVLNRSDKTRADRLVVFTDKE
ncbi:MAG: class F sortase [Candidatus Pacebacteria bacterium]|nr:class F sortase [Candidatus Paceibacterota bacterium]